LLESYYNPEVKSKVLHFLFIVISSIVVSAWRVGAIFLYLYLYFVFFEFFIVVDLKLTSDAKRGSIDFYERSFFVYKFWEDVKLLKAFE
jgi:hypothetical protein